MEIFLSILAKIRSPIHFLNCLFNDRKPPIKYLGLSASKFTEESASIEKFLKIRKNDDVAQNQTNDLPASKYQCEEPETDRKSMETTQLPSTSQLKNSFFLQFLSKRKDLEKSVAAEKQHEAKEDENESHWISLSEIIPDVNTAEEDVVNILPAPLKKKFHERLKYNKQKENDAGHEAETTMSIIPNDDVPYFDNQFPKETCNECGKQIPLNVFLEHLDYHVALKLESEINRTASVSNKPKVTNEILSKRKKNVLETRSKKMKSITSFFTVAPKQN